MEGDVAQRVNVPLVGSPKQEYVSIEGKVLPKVAVAVWRINLLDHSAIRSVPVDRKRGPVWIVGHPYQSGVSREDEMTFAQAHGSNQPRLD